MNVSIRGYKVKKVLLSNYDNPNKALTNLTLRPYETITYLVSDYMFLLGIGEISLIFIAVGILIITVVSLIIKVNIKEQTKKLLKNLMK